MTLFETIELLRRHFKRSLKRAKYRSKKKGMDFNLSFSDLRNLYFLQKARCFYTGQQFDFKDKLKRLSLDRVDSDEGYIVGNVVWCLLEINYIKYKFKYSSIKEICLKLLTHNPNWKLVDEQLRLQ